MPLCVGEALGPYDIVAPIGKHGMGKGIAPMNTQEQLTVE